VIKLYVLFILYEVMWNIFAPLIGLIKQMINISVSMSEETLPSLKKKYVVDLERKVRLVCHCSTVRSLCTYYSLIFSCSQKKHHKPENKTNTKCNTREMLKKKLLKGDKSKAYFTVFPVNVLQICLP
jgi:hypothetical protein